MSKPVPVTRLDKSAIDLRREASRCRDGAVVRRLLAIALVLDGRPRTDAAEACGMDRQTLSNDPEFAFELRDVVGLYVRPADHAIVLSIDEKSRTSGAGQHGKAAAQSDATGLLPSSMAQADSCRNRWLQAPATNDSKRPIPSKPAPPPGTMRGSARVLAEPPKRRVPLTEPLRLIAPQAARARHPQHRLQKQPVLRPLRPGSVGLPRQCGSIFAHSAFVSTSRSISSVPHIRVSLRIPQALVRNQTERLASFDRLGRRHAQGHTLALPGQHQSGQREGLAQRL